MPQLFSALRVLGRHTVMKSAVARASLAPGQQAWRPRSEVHSLSQCCSEIGFWITGTNSAQRLVRDLERSGELAAVVAALEQTILEKQAVMLKKGLSLEQADELLRPMWMISDDDS